MIYRGILIQLFMKKHVLGLLIFFAIYILCINLFNVSDINSDEARHAAQGMVFLDYWQDLGESGYSAYRDFLDQEYTSRYPKASYYGLYDPPAHAVFMALSYKLVSPTIFTIRVTNQILIGLLLGLIYLLFNAVLKNWKESLGAIILFFLLPYTYMLSRQVMLAIPVALLTCGWYYFTLYKETKTSKDLAIRIIAGGICLSGASLMMYQTLVYVPIFMILFAVSEAVKHKEKFISEFTQRVTFIMLVQMVICSVLVFWWFSLSFADSSVFELLTRAGTQEIKGGDPGSLSYIFSFPAQLLTGTLFLALIGLFSLRNKPFVQKHWHLFVFILVVLVTATLVLSNRQLRYITHVIPFIALLIVVGYKELFTILKQSKKIAYSSFAVLCLVLLAFNVYASYETIQEQGVYTHLYSQLATESAPRTFIALDIAGDFKGVPYMHTADTVMFNLMALDRPGQSASYLQVSNLRSLAIVVDQMKSANLYFIIYEPMLKTSLGKEIRDFFVYNEFSASKSAPYIVFHHTKRNPQPYLFPSFADTKKAEELVEEAQGYIEKKDYDKAVVILENAMKLEPRHTRLRIALSGLYAAYAINSIDDGDLDAAERLYKRALQIYPWINEELAVSSYGDKLDALLEKEPAVVSNSTST